MYSFLFGNGYRTLSGYYDTCSYGQVKLLPSQVKIMGNITIPCSGTLQLPFRFPTGNTIDTSSCAGDNLLKWQYYADSVAMERGVTPTDYNHKVIFFPPGYVARSKCGEWR
jgi:hypothetical protein